MKSDISVGDSTSFLMLHFILHLKCFFPNKCFIAKQKHEKKQIKTETLTINKDEKNGRIYLSHCTSV